MTSLLLGMIRLYQYLLSPWVGNQCRFWPTCSEYARLAIIHHGSAKGSLLAVRRVCRCHPWHPGGFDPVPGVPLPDDYHDEPEPADDAPDDTH
ncbi:membrane protein insertion efficiency factor YidD [Alcanivorax quisquiliarum]|uniref:Putative membrane protein insertion efficiency factor n=1 Tax=Alcanivorax quisquiliarum TaxID=2933565 RepID=A0ABT0E6J3_9GAMM|nr:membrane protein insertion efficiency factor YidD [Alcanivorax quisquiliarum]